MLSYSHTHSSPSSSESPSLRYTLHTSFGAYRITPFISASFSPQYFYPPAQVSHALRLGKRIEKHGVDWDWGSRQKVDLPLNLWRFISKRGNEVGLCGMVRDFFLVQRGAMVTKGYSILIHRQRDEYSHAQKASIQHHMPSIDLSSPVPIRPDST